MDNHFPKKDDPPPPNGLPEDPRYHDALRVLSELELGGFKARLAGGCVRDRLLGVKPYDYDIVTDGTPEEVIRSLKSFHHKVIPTGIAHGTVTALTRTCPIEITTLRRDVKTDGRRATVAFGADFEEDAKRRDFTINALFEDKFGQIYDYVCGQEDLRNRVLRFVGDPSERIAEDALRILRFFRFWSRLGFDPAAGTIDAIKPLVLGLKKVSQERITSEVLQLFSGIYFEKTLESLHGSHTLLTVDKALGQGLEIYLDKRGKRPLALESVPATHRNLAIIALFLLLAHQGQTIDSDLWASSFKMSNRDKKILHLSHHFMTDIPPLKASRGQRLHYLSLCRVKELTFDNFFYPLWTSYLKITKDSATSSRREDLETNIESLRTLSYQYRSLIEEKMPLNGTDIQRHFGPIPGEQLGLMLFRARMSWFEGVWHSTEEAMRWLEQHGKDDGSNLEK